MFLVWGGIICIKPPQVVTSLRNKNAHQYRSTCQSSVHKNIGMITPIAAHEQHYLRYGKKHRHDCSSRSPTTSLSSQTIAMITRIAAQQQHYLHNVGATARIPEQKQKHLLSPHSHMPASCTPYQPASKPLSQHPPSIEVHYVTALYAGYRSRCNFAVCITQRRNQICEPPTRGKQLNT